MTVDEPRAIELLPWYVSGSLSQAESEQVERWLETSAEVREELREVRRALEIFDPVVPVEAVLDTASGAGDGAWPQDLVERLADGGPVLKEELEAARQGFEAVHAVPARAVEHDGLAAAGRWRRAALAATLVAAVTGVGWMRSALETIDGIDGQAARLNPATVDVFSNDLALRGSAEAVVAAESTPGLVVFLHSELPNDAAVGGVALSRIDGDRLWTATGDLERGATGEFAVRLSMRPLEPGRYRLELLAGEPVGSEVAERFDLRVGSLAETAPRP